MNVARQATQSAGNWEPNRQRDDAGGGQEDQAGELGHPPGQESGGEEACQYPGQGRLAFEQGAEPKIRPSIGVEIVGEQDRRSAAGQRDKQGSALFGYRYGDQRGIGGEDNQEASDHPA